MPDSSDVMRALSDLLSELQAKLDEGNIEEARKTVAEIKGLFPTSATVPAGSADEEAGADRGNANEDGFWYLGPPKEKKYRKPDFETPPGTYDISIAGSKTDNARPEPIPEKGSLKIPEAPRRLVSVDHDAIPEKEDSVVRKYSFYHEGLLSSATIRSRPVDSAYSHFSRDVAQSHRSSPVKQFASLSPVPFQSYIPQFSHMNSQQIEFYRAWREEVRKGLFPAADLPYIILYIYEVINLPDLIPPQQGVRILSSLWLAYRGTYPRLDGFLGEWMADYCLIHELPLPKSLLPFIPSIVPKSQFKEFYIHPLLLLAKNGEKENISLLGRAIAETLSDYDYTQSKCYMPNKAFYDSELPYLVGAFIVKAIADSAAPLSLDRFYSITRESYSGAMVAPGIRMRIDLSFLSFTRRAESRQVITSAVKECENRLRSVLGIKSKLKTEPLQAGIQACLYETLNTIYPLTGDPKQKEPEYMEYYEPESSGYDYELAAELEQSSWTNTERLTGEDLTSNDPECGAADENPEGAVSSGDFIFETGKAVCTENSDADITTKGAIRAALDSEFSLYCRENGLNEGNMADTVNSLFLDILGDVIIEPDPAGISYNLVEDYRKEIEEWLQTY